MLMASEDNCDAGIISCAVDTVSSPFRLTKRLYILKKEEKKRKRDKPVAARASSSTKRFFQKGPEAAAEVGEAAEAPGAEGRTKRNLRGAL